MILHRSDRDTAGLRGLVSKCETLSNGMTTRELFDRSGNRTERWHRGADGFLIHMATWTYDRTGRLQAHEIAGKSLEIRRYEYDEHGRLARVVSQSPDRERIFESYVYHQDGSSTWTTFPAPVPRDGEVG